MRFEDYLFNQLPHRGEVYITDVRDNAYRKDYFLPAKAGFVTIFHAKTNTIYTYRFEIPSKITNRLNYNAILEGKLNRRMAELATMHTKDEFTLIWVFPKEEVRITTHNKQLYNRVMVRLLRMFKSRRALERDKEEFLSGRNLSLFEE